MGDESQRHCVICGATVKNINPKVNTCSAFCTERKRTGMSREELILLDCQIPKEDTPNKHGNESLHDYYDPQTWGWNKK